MKTIVLWKLLYYENWQLQPTTKPKTKICEFSSADKYVAEQSMSKSKR